MLDSNFLGRGQFSSSELDGILSRVDPETEIVIPEVVLWEWTEHAYTSIEKVVKAHRSFHVDPELFAIPNLPVSPSKSELLGSIQASLQKSRGEHHQAVTIWWPPADVFEPAVKAQVLQTGVAERKEGVKTGAADHLVLECVRAQLEDRQIAEPVLLASKDKRLQKACDDEFGAEVMTAESQRELLSRLIDFTPAEDELSELVEEQIRERLCDGSSDIGRAFAEFDMGFQIGRPQTPATQLPPTRKQSARLGPVSIVELHNLEIGEVADGARFGFADFRILADVDLTMLELQTGQEVDTEWATVAEARMRDWVVDFTASVTFDSDWNLSSVKVSSPASIFSGDDEDDGDGPGEVP